MKPAIDIVGRNFGHWTVIRRHSENRGALLQWECKCACGTERVVLGNSLHRGKSTNCGCVKRQKMSEVVHGHAKKRNETPTYQVWKHMIQRCENPKCKDFKYYGDRGISIDPEWRNNFSAFLRDMGARPAGMTIDRIDNDQGYKPGNCRWATMAQQNSNKRGIYIARSAA